MENHDDESRTKKQKRKTSFKKRERKSRLKSKHKKKKEHSRRKYRNEEDTDDYSSSFSSSSISAEDRRYKKKKRTKEKRHRPEGHHDKSLRAPPDQATIPLANSFADPEVSQNKQLPTELTLEFKKKAMVPMTKEEYERQQNTIKEVFDEQSGRYRLIRGTGEIIERIVSKDDHQRINKNATKYDGISFSKHISKEASQRDTFLNR